METHDPPAGPPSSPLWPVRPFGDTRVVDRVARFGMFLFAMTDRGWRVVDQVAPDGSVDYED